MEYDYRETMKLDNQLCFALYAASRHVTGLYAPFLKPLGLTYTQYLAFLVLWEKDGITVGDLGSRLMLDNGTLSPMLKKMEAAGYVEKKRSKDDDRVVIIRLTKAGRDLQKRAKKIPEQIGSCIDLPIKKGVQLHKILYELLEKQGCSKKGGK